MTENPNRNARSSSNRWERSDPSNPKQSVDNSGTFAKYGRQMTAMAAFQNGRDPPEMDDETAAAVGQRVLSNQSTRDATRGRMKQMQRTDIRGLDGPGRSHFGARDYWKTFGYPEPGSISPLEFQQRAKFQDMAKIITEAPVTTTWKHTPIIRDDAREEGDDPTQFELDMQKLLDGTISSISGDEVERAGLDTYWQWVDKKQRPVQFGLLFFGYDDGRSMDQPVNPSGCNGPDDLAYCNAFSQADVTDWWLADNAVFDENDPLVGDVKRPDKPICYEIRFEKTNPDGTVDYDKRIVHHSRVIHIVESPDDSEYLGPGCLDSLVPRLIDHEKTMGAAAEAQYANVDRKYIGKGTESGELGPDREEMLELFDEQMFELENDMRSTAYMENMEMDVVSGENVDPSGVLDALYPSFSGVTGMPQRIMKGSERGDLASTQDDANWYSNMGERQTQFAEPRISRATVNNFIRYGVVTEPEHKDNSYTLIWPSLWELTEIEKANQAEKRAHAVERAENAIAAGADRDAIYSWVGIPQPDDGGQEGSGETTGGADPSRNIDEDSSEVQDQFESSGMNSDRSPVETNDSLPAIADGGAVAADPEGLAAQCLSMDVNASMDDLDDVYDDYTSAVNMSYSDLEDWDDHACSSEASNSRAPIDRNLRLLDTNKDDWDIDDIGDAQRTISFINRMRSDEKPEDPSDGATDDDGTESPSKWAISLRNWAHDPLGKYS